MWRTTAGAIYTGLANGNVGNANFLYTQPTTPDMSAAYFDRTFQNVVPIPCSSGKFTDPNALPGFQSLQHYRTSTVICS